MLAGERLKLAQDRIPPAERGPFVQANVSSTSYYRSIVALMLYSSFRNGLDFSARSKLRLAYRMAYLRHCRRQLRMVAQLPAPDRFAHDNAAAKASAISKRLAIQAAGSRAVDSAGADEHKLSDEDDDEDDLTSSGIAASARASAIDDADGPDLDPFGRDLGSPNSIGISKGLDKWEDDRLDREMAEAEAVVEISADCAIGIGSGLNSGDAEAWLVERHLNGLREFEVNCLCTAIARTAKMGERMLRAGAILPETACNLEELLIGVRRLVAVLDIEDAVHLTDAEARELGPAVEKWHRAKATRLGPPKIDDRNPTLAPVRGFRGLDFLLNRRDATAFEGESMATIEEQFVDIALGPRPGIRVDGRVDFRGDLHDILSMLRKATLGVDKLMSRTSGTNATLVAHELCALIEDVFLHHLPVPWTWNEARVANEAEARESNDFEGLDHWLTRNRARINQESDLDDRRLAREERRQYEEVALQAHQDGARTGTCDPWQPPCEDNQLLAEVTDILSSLLQSYLSSRVSMNNMPAESG